MEWKRLLGCWRDLVICWKTVIQSYLESRRLRRRIGAGLVDKFQHELLMIRRVAVIEALGRSNKNLLPKGDCENDGRGLDGDFHDDARLESLNEDMMVGYYQRTIANPS